MNDKKEKNRTVIVGIDGATFKIIKPLIKKGKLPNISQLITDGVCGNLRSGLPGLSPSIWTTIVTGKNPGKHGIYDFMHKNFRNNKIVFNSSVDRKEKPIWSILSECKKRVCVAGLIMSYPPDKVNGCMVSSLFTPASLVSVHKGTSYVFPATMEDEIEEIRKDFAKQKKIIDRRKKNIRHIISKDIIESINCRTRIYRHLSKKEKFDFRLFYFSETDIISHLTWKYMKEENRLLGNAIFQAYEAIDRYLGEVASEKNSDIIVVSDHGFRELKRIVSLNNFLQARGFLRYKKRDRLTKFKRMITEVILRILGGEKRFGHMSMEELIKGIDWQATKAYYFGTTAGAIYINLRGKESSGVVEPHNYDTLCTKIIEELKRIKDPQTGKRMVKDVYKKKDLFKGKYTENAPDLSVIFADGYGVKIKKNDRFLPKEIVTESKDWTGDHDINGIFIARGPHFKKNNKIEGASVQDIAPTVLYIMGVPIPKDTDGRILMEAIDRDFAAKNPPVYKEYKIPLNEYQAGSVYDKKEERKIAEHLKDLGYLD